jgi:hypothetical protein
MAMAQRTDQPPLHRVVLAGGLAWILPGMGHVYGGDRRRGLVLLVVMSATFWGGVAIAGVQSTVQPRARKAWFLAQVCAGTHTLVAFTWGTSRAQQFPKERAQHMAEEIGIIYTGVIGLLNILVILDAMAAVDPKYVRTPARPSPRQRGNR